MLNRKGGPRKRSWPNLVYIRYAIRTFFLTCSALWISVHVSSVLRTRGRANIPLAPDGVHLAGVSAVIIELQRGCRHYRTNFYPLYLVWV